MPAITAADRTLAGRLALLLLVAVSAVAAHQAPYLFHAGDLVGAVGDEPAHDAIRAPLVLLIGIVAAGVGVVAWRQLRRITAHAAHAGGAAHPPRELRSFLGDVASLWLRVGLATALVYGFQENAEHLLAGLGPSGLHAFAAHGLLPVVVVLLASLLVASVAGLVRWHCRELLARIARARSRHARRPARAPRQRLSIRLPRAVSLGDRGSRAPPEAVAAVA